MLNLLADLSVFNQLSPRASKLLDQMDSYWLF